jgi:hypothetical protein
VPIEEEEEEYLFLKALLHVSMCIRHHNGISYYVWQIYKISKMEMCVQVVVKNIRCVRLLTVLKMFVFFAI